MSSNFLLDSRHCEAISLSIWTLLSAFKVLEFVLAGLVRGSAFPKTSWPVSRRMRLALRCPGFQPVGHPFIQVTFIEYLLSSEH